MTQYRHPDYNAEILIERGEFRQLSGISLDVLLTFGRQTRQIRSHI